MREDDVRARALARWQPGRRGAWARADPAPADICTRWAIAGWCLRDAPTAHAFAPAPRACTSRPRCGAAAWTARRGQVLQERPECDGRPHRRLPARAGTRLSVIAPGGLAPRIERLAAALLAARPRPRVVGLLADNGADWVAIDLAAQQAGVALVPLPASSLPHTATRRHERHGSLFCISCPAETRLRARGQLRLDGIAAAPKQ